MLREMILTEDGSHTIVVPEKNVTYHSLHGAIRESEHVFIASGFQAMGQLHLPEGLSVFEMGFGSGLNALLTFIEAGKIRQKVFYTAIDLYPLNEEEVRALNYCRHLQRPDLGPLFYKFHEQWENEITIDPGFILYKSKQSLLDFETDQQFHLIYFDAFAPGIQPELWTMQVFEKMHNMLYPGGILVTYSSKGDVRRAMTKAGFTIEKIPGPPKKREIVRARSR